MLSLDPEAIDLATLRQLWKGAPARLCDAALERVDEAAASVARIVAGGETVYGINTGFGLLAQERIPPERLSELQRNLILSHSCGVGEPAPAAVVRLMIHLKLLGLGRGHSGVRRSVIDGLQRLLDADALPLVPSQGSVGASGDLAPLAHMTAALMGHGRIAHGGEVLPATDVLGRLDLVPLELGPKEGLALINGTQYSTAAALHALFQAERVLGAALQAGALSVDALKGSAKPFDPRLSALRGQPGQMAVAAIVASLLEGSAIIASHHRCGRVQDPYSFRCMPQVLGASLDLLRTAARTLEIEAGAVTDNPILFPDTDEAISGGNFHAQPVAFAADLITMALCEIGSLAERRISVLVDPKMSGLPAFLIEDGGVNSGLMIPQVTAAALVAENRANAFPASVDSIPTSAGQEDHVSMAPISGHKAIRVARNCAAIVAIEYIAAAQGIDYHAPLRTSERLQAVHAQVRAMSPHLDADRMLADEIGGLQTAILDGRFGSDFLLPL